MFYVYRNNTSVLLQFELPGFKIEDIDVTIENDELHIKASRKATEARIIINEIPSNEIIKSFQLDRNLDLESLQATIKDGILSVQFATSKQKKSILIQAA